MYIPITAKFINARKAASYFQPNNPKENAYAHYYHRSF